MSLEARLLIVLLVMHAGAFVWLFGLVGRYYPAVGLPAPFPQDLDNDNPDLHATLRRDKWVWERRCRRLERDLAALRDITPESEEERTAVRRLIDQMIERQIMLRLSEPGTDDSRI